MSLLKFPVKLLGFLPLFIIKLVAFKYVAGETLAAARDKIKMLNEQGFVGTLDILGEASDSEEKVEAFVYEYKELIKTIANQKIKAGISVKPTAVGLLISYEYALRQFREIVKALKDDQIFLRIDMEDSPYTDQTIKLYNELKQEYERVGIVFQAYLKRTWTDLENIKPDGDVRLCKGIYLESFEISFKGKDLVRQNYLKCLEYMLTNNFKIGVATHDDGLLEGAIDLLKKYHLDKQRFEFQMLYGVRTQVAKKLVGDGYKVRLYIPYGKDWYAYSMRRMYENPNIALHVTKALFWDPVLALFTRLKE